MIAVDWGGSSVRAYRLSSQGTILERRTSSAGVFESSSRPFEATLESLIGDWLAAGDSSVVMSGMIGSRRGWIEVPYQACPARLDDLAAGRREVRWATHRAWIMPGLACRSATGAPDVMRGEETQVAGVLGGLPDPAVICLPGTHTKWVDYADGTIRGFRTAPTGEIYRLLAEKSSLVTMPPEGPIDPVWFAAGLGRSDDAGGLLQHLFGVRAAQMIGDLGEQHAASVLSGILIGHDVREEARPGQLVHLLGDPSLTDLYRVALERRGVRCVLLDPDAAAYGLFALSRAIEATA